MDKSVLAVTTLFVHNLPFISLLMPNKKKTSSSSAKSKASSGKSSASKSNTAPKKTTATKAAKSTASKRPADSSKSKRSASAAPGSTKPVVPPIASVARVRTPRPHAFTLEDVEEFLQTRKPSTQEKAKARVSPETPSSAAKTTSARAEEEQIPAPVKQSHEAASLADILGFNPGEQENAAEKALSEIPKKFHKHYKDLQKLRSQVLESLEFHTEETLNRSAKEDSGDLSGYGQHQADAGTDNYDRDYALSLVSDGQELLFEIEEAIKRIHNGTYGICEVTGKVINKERLNAVPFARYSLEGQIEFEKTQRRHSQRGGIFDSALEESPTFGNDDDSED